MLCVCIGRGGGGKSSCCGRDSIGRGLAKGKEEREAFALSTRAGVRERKKRARLCNTQHAADHTKANRRLRHCKQLNNPCCRQEELFLRGCAGRRSEGARSVACQARPPVCFANQKESNNKHIRACGAQARARVRRRAWSGEDRCQAAPLGPVKHTRTKNEKGWWRVISKQQRLLPPRALVHARACCRCCFFLGGNETEAVVAAFAVVFCVCVMWHRKFFSLICFLLEKEAHTILFCKRQC